MTYRSIIKSAILGLLCASQAQASCNTTACDNDYITELRVEATGNILINTSGDESSLNCTLSSGMIVLLPTDANAAQIYAMLLTVQQQGKPIGRIRIVSTSNPCRVSYVWQLE